MFAVGAGEGDSSEAPPASSPVAPSDGSYVGRDGELRALLGLASQAQLGDGRGDVSLATPLHRHSLDVVRGQVTQELVSIAISLAEALVLQPVPGGHQHP